jgi:phosphoglycerol transferase MdoB-like AlkP superfamily enzyme
MKLNSAIIHYLRRLLGALVGLGFLRLLFLVLNRNSFSHASFFDYVRSFVAGVYFDYIYVFYALLPILLLSFFGSYLYKYKWLRWFESIYFIAIFLVTTVLACIDMAYFPFVKSHIGADLLFFLDSENNISIWTYIFHYWYLLLVCLGLPTVVWYFFGKLIKGGKGYSTLQIVPRLGAFILMALVVRGGTRLRPITSLDAVLFAPTNMESLVANPAFIFVESLNTKSDLHFEEELDLSHVEESNRKCYAMIDSANAQLQFDSLPENPNIVLIILESFGKEFTSLNRAELPSYTPFLDSLMKVSYSFNNAFANGSKSKDAIPALFTGVPSLVKDGFLTSKYSKNNLLSVPNYLKQFGYSSMFFHGANNGSMGFRNFLLSHGLDEYYGINQYENRDRDFDGHWGIFDEPYLSYVRETLSEKKTPFFATVFTLSSHDPYAIPERYDGQLPREKVKLHRSIRYADLALRNFFKTAMKEPWAKNTLFFITADHSSLNESYMYQAGTGKFEVPFMVYADKAFGLVGSSEKAVQHIDFLPTVLDLLHCEDTVSVFGESFFAEKSSALVFKDGSSYYIREGDWELKVVNNQPINLHNLAKDPERLDDVIGGNQNRAEQMLLELRIQQSNFAKKLIFNHFF